MSPELLAGKRLLITGVATEDSIAFATALRARAMGAEVVLTAYPRDLEQVKKLVADAGVSSDVLPLDLTRPSEVDQLTGILCPASAHSTVRFTPWHSRRRMPWTVRSWTPTPPASSWRSGPARGA